jgi:hypothetical protein
MNFPSSIFTLKIPGFIGILFIANVLFSQGSGDAGLISSGDFDSRSRSEDTPSRIYFLQKAGVGSGDAICLSSEFHLDWNIWGGINLWFAVPYRVTIGDLATVHGLGDLRVVFSHTLAEAGDFVVKINVGGLIPSGNGNKEQEGKSLPMVYQPSQGSASFMVSSMFYFRSWNLSVGYQRPVSGNRNQFTKAIWDNDNAVSEYPDSPELRCGDDLLIRVSKYFDRPRARYSLSLLPGFRLSEDQIMSDGKRLVVEGSSGFSLNVTAGVEVRLGTYGYFHFLAAFPVLQRDVYPDGLDRIVQAIAGFGVQLPE